MAEIDTSSYPKFNQPKSMVEQAKDWQGLEQGSITLQQSKLKQMNDQFNLANAELSTLANDPSITKETAAQRLTTLSKTFNLKPDITNHLLNELNQAPNVKMFAQNALTRLMTIQEKVNNLYGTPSIYSQGQQDTPVNVSPMRGMTPTGLPIQRQIPPTTQVLDENKQPTLQGPTAPMAPPGIATGPGQRLPIANQPLQRPRSMLPIGKGNLTNDGQVTGVDIQDVTPNQQVARRYPSPSGPAVGTPPMFEEGKKKYSEDLDLSTKLNTTNKPAELALKMMDGLRSGPGTALWQQALAFGKANGLLPIGGNDDPTVVYQTINKLMHNFIRGGGARSDADLAQLEASNPDLSQHINPALENLTREQIGLNRVQAARPNAFNSKNFTKYGEHASQFPQDQDERAYTINTLPKEKAKKLYQEMKSKALKGDADGIRFMKSLAIADKLYK